MQISKKEIEQAKENAESVRLVAMENLADTRKRKIDNDTSPTSSKRKKDWFRDPNIFDGQIKV